MFTRLPIQTSTLPDRAGLGGKDGLCAVCCVQCLVCVCVCVRVCHFIHPSVRTCIHPYIRPPDHSLMHRNFSHFFTQTPGTKHARPQHGQINCVYICVAPTPSNICVCVWVCMYAPNSLTPIRPMMHVCMSVCLHACGDVRECCMGWVYVCV